MFVSLYFVCFIGLLGLSLGMHREGRAPVTKCGRATLHVYLSWRIGVFRTHMMLEASDGRGAAFFVVAVGQAKTKIIPA